MKRRRRVPCSGSALALQLCQGSIERAILARQLIEGADSDPLLAIPFLVLAAS